MFQNLSNFFWIFFYPGAVVWASITFLRRLLLEDRGYRSQLPVLCVGNLHSGGSSKTPIVIEIAKHFKSKQPAILSRGYRRASKVPVSELDLAHKEGANFFGDEPWLIAKETGLPVWIGKNRGKLARSVEAKDGAKMLILDDGFQNFSLRKDLSVVCIGTEKKLTEANTLPLGELRESFHGLAGADAVVLIQGNDAFSFQLWRDYLENAWEDLPVFTATPKYSVEPEAKAGKWLAFCGIAGPGRFRSTLDSLGVDYELATFEDHHRYTSKDIEYLTVLKRKHEAVGFITTQKDFYKAVESFEQINEKLIFVKMEMKIEESFKTFLNDRVSER